ARIPSQRAVLKRGRPSCQAGHKEILAPARIYAFPVTKLVETVLLEQRTPGVPVLRFECVTGSGENPPQAPKRPEKICRSTNILTQAWLVNGFDTVNTL